MHMWLLEKYRVSGKNPHTQGENMWSPHRKVPTQFHHHFGKAHHAIFLYALIVFCLFLLEVLCCESNFAFVWTTHHEFSGPQLCCVVDLVFSWFCLSSGGKFCVGNITFIFINLHLFFPLHLRLHLGPILLNHNSMSSFQWCDHWCKRREKLILYLLCSAFESWIHSKVKWPSVQFTFKNVIV